MINHFAQVSLYKDDLGSIARSQETKKSFVLSYPCSSPCKCTPYVIKLQPSVYKFECWGSSSRKWENSVSESTPGLGGYTSGFLYVHNPTTFYVYVGGHGVFNAMKEKEIDRILLPSPGGATDVRLNVSENWWDESSLISRIMVAAGAGGAEWVSTGGNGGGIEGGSSLYSSLICEGAKQTSGSECDPRTAGDQTFLASKGSFGSAGIINPVSTDDYGAIGGGGYYGGTSYTYSFAASGGSSFISGHKGCDAVKEQIETIEHTGQPNHYSGLIFTNTEMISGNNTMPVPTSFIDRKIYSGLGAFRLTLIHYQYHCTYRKTIFRFLPFTLFIFIK